MHFIVSLILFFSITPVFAMCGPVLDARPFFSRVADPASVADAREVLADRLDRAFILYILRKFSPVAEWLSRPVRFRFNQATYIVTFDAERFDLRRADGARVLSVYPVTADLEEILPERAAEFLYGRDLSFHLQAPDLAVPALNALLKMRRPRDRAAMAVEMSARDKYLRGLRPQAHR